MTSSAVFFLPPPLNIFQVGGPAHILLRRNLTFFSGKGKIRLGKYRVKREKILRPNKMARKTFVSNLIQFAAFGLPFFHFPPSLSFPSDLGLMRGREVEGIPHLGEGREERRGRGV